MSVKNKFNQFMQGAKKAEYRLEHNDVVQKGIRMGKWALENQDKVASFGEDLGKNIGTDAAEGAVEGSVEPGGGTALGGVAGAAVGVGQTVWQHWGDIKEMAEQ